MERTLYLWRSTDERAATGAPGAAHDQHLVVLTDRDGADIVLVAQLRRVGGLLSA